MIYRTEKNKCNSKQHNILLTIILANLAKLHKISMPPHIPHELIVRTEIDPGIHLWYHHIFIALKQTLCRRERNLSLSRRDRNIYKSAT